jgi:hypothetical protein
MKIYIIKTLIFYATLAVFASAFAGCENDTTPAKQKNTQVTWTLEQFGGSPAGGGNPAVESTGIIITFSSKLYSLNKAEVVISGAAMPDATRAFTWSGRNWTVPVVVFETGVATVTINKPGVAAGSKKVTVYKSDDITWTTEQINVDPAGGGNPEESFTGILIKFSSALPSDLD